MIWWDNAWSERSLGGWSGNAHWHCSLSLSPSLSPSLSDSVSSCLCYSIKFVPNTSPILTSIIHASLTSQIVNADYTTWCIRGNNSYPGNHVHITSQISTQLCVSRILKLNSPLRTKQIKTIQTMQRKRVNVHHPVSGPHWTCAFMEDLIEWSTQQCLMVSSSDQACVWPKWPHLAICTQCSWHGSRQALWGPLGPLGQSANITEWVSHMLIKNN